MTDNPYSPATLIAQGYQPGPPTEQVGIIDARAVTNWPCPRCGDPQKYEAWHKPDGSYIALAVCNDCGTVIEF